MQQPYHLHITLHHPDARESNRLPAHCSYRIAYAQTRCWRGDRWWLAEQWHDARHVYLYLLEAHTVKSLKLTVETLRPDLHWLYPFAGEFRVHRADGALAGHLLADEHVVTAVMPSTYQVTMMPGRHLLFGFVAERGWPGRYLGTYLSFLRTPRSVPITPAMRGELLTLAALPLREGMVMDADVYRHIARITELTRQAHAADTTRKTGSGQSLELVDAARQHIRDVLEAGGTPPAISRIAEHLGVSPDHLSRVHKKHYGTGLQAFLTRQRLGEAYRLLSEEGLSVSAVTYRLGFTDIPAFSKLFRKYFHQAPSQVRKG